MTRRYCTAAGCTVPCSELRASGGDVCPIDRDREKAHVVATARREAEILAPNSSDKMLYRNMTEAEMTSPKAGHRHIPRHMQSDPTLPAVLGGNALSPFTGLRYDFDGS